MEHAVDGTLRIMEFYSYEGKWGFMITDYIFDLLTRKKTVYWKLQYQIILCF